MLAINLTATQSLGGQWSREEENLLGGPAMCQREKV